MKPQFITKKIYRAQPAADIIGKMGGPNQAAEALDLHVTTIYSWMKPKSQGGSGGRIPAGRIPACIRAAKAQGNKVTPEDFAQIEAKPGTARVKNSRREQVSA